MTEHETGTGTPQAGGFTVTVHENKYLSTEATQMVAVLTVTADGVGDADGDGAGGPVSGEVILLDCSGSMADPPTKLSTAKEATCAAIDALRDGALFAVVRGSQEAGMAYPAEPDLVVASDATRAAAKEAVRGLTASGGTAMGAWLRLADRLLAAHPSAVRHAILITDGKQENESREELDRALAACADHFGCDARGIGDAWDPTELGHITSVLNGQTRGVAEFDEMVDDVTELMRAAMRRVVPEVGLRVRTVTTARLVDVRQVYPTFLDLNPRRVQLDGMTSAFATGSWANETREYQLCLEVDPGQQLIGEDLLAARVDVVAGDAPGAAVRTAPPALILVHWTDDPVLPTRLDRKVTHYAGQEELGDAVRAGCDAYLSGAWDEAAAELGRAVRLAAESGNADILGHLGRLVEVEDAEAGEVRLRKDVSVSELLATAASSVFTSRDNGPAGQQAVPAGPPRTCPNPHCGYKSPPDAVVCEGCGHRFETSEDAGSP